MSRESKITPHDGQRESGENLMLALDEKEVYALFEKSMNGVWHPTYGDLLLLGLYSHYYQKSLEDFIIRLDLNKIADDVHTEDIMDDRRNRTNREKLIEIKTLIEEMNQRRKANRIMEFVKNGEK
jgi:hypothetical protein